MLHTTHRGLRRAVDAYLDGELPSGRAAAVASHLDECWGCSGYADTVRLMKQSLRRPAAREPRDLAVTRLRRWGQRLASS
jgi:anti-sigma factor RsiW